MKKKMKTLKIHPLVAAISIALPLVSNAANINMATVNGVPVAEINAANAQGISHNIYDKLNVGKEGLIFNNSKDAIQTSLAGKIDGNSNLSGGSAKVILNEVSSRNSSSLKGMMEVAGDKAHLIIANPNGITCDSCGFINTDKVTMTTGKADLSNGELKGFSVNGGTITTNGLVSDSPTAILARSVVVNGNIDTKKQDLTLVAGNNYVDSNNQVTGQVKSQGGRNTFGIDVAKLGGMYANKISLISTENGIGVRNAGLLSAGTGGINIDANGRLINNNGTIKSSGAVALVSNGALENTIGKISSSKTIAIDTKKNRIINTRSGSIMSGENIYINSGEFNNTNGKIAATGTIGLDTNNNTLINSGKGDKVGIEAGVVTLKTGTLNNSNGQIKGYYVGTQSTAFNNRNGVIDSSGNVDITSTGNSSFNNTSGLIRSAAGHVKIDAVKSSLDNGQTKTADSDSSDSLGIIAGDGGIQLAVANLNNGKGQILSSSDISIETSGNINNGNGAKLASDKTISLKGQSLDSIESSIAGKGGINIDLSDTYTNRTAVIKSEDGTVNVKARNMNNTGGVLVGKNINIDVVNNVNSDAALVSAQDNLTVKAGGDVRNQYSHNFATYYGIYLGMANQEGGMFGNTISMTANNLNNNYSRLVAKSGPLQLDIARTIANDHGMIVGAGSSTIKTKTFNTNYSTVYSKGDLTIDANTLSLLSSGSFTDNNASGYIVAEGALDVNVAQNFNNYGWLNGKKKVTVKTNGVFSNFNTVYSENETNVTGAKGVRNYKTMIGDVKLNVNSESSILNQGQMYSDGKTTVTAKTINNSGTSSVIGGGQGLETKADSITGNGKFISL